MISRRLLRMVLVALTLAIPSLALDIDARADTIRFRDFATASSETLQLDGVTISAYDGHRGRDGEPGVPATVLGKGLGSALIGPTYTIDRLLSFEAGSWNHTSISELLQLRVDGGTINSITIDPYFSVLSPDPVMFPFGIHFASYSGQPPVYLTVDPRGTGPVTIPIPPSYFEADTRTQLLFIGVGYDTVPGTDGAIYNYLRDNGYPALTFQMGFTITELDYTPFPVPEPSTFLLMVAGIAAAVARQRGRRRHIHALNTKL